MENKIIDIHCHILPAIDDGPDELAECLEMIEQASAAGTRMIVATPHVIYKEHQPKWTDIVARCHTLTASARERGLAIDIVPGAEVAIMPEIVREFHGNEYCINGGKYMLTELPMLQMPNYVDSVVFGLQTRGITPILAHPERYPEVIRNPEIVLDWLHKGLLSQVNSKSITGLFGEEVQRCADILLHNQVVTCVASDAHTSRGRNPKMQDVYNLLVDRLGAAYAEQLFYSNPDRIVKSERVEQRVPQFLTLPRTNWLSKIARFFRG